MKAIEEWRAKTPNYCKTCGIEISSKATNCVSCSQKLRQVVGRPTREELKLLIREVPFTHIAEIYYVSDNAIRKWCDKYKLPRTKKEINSYSNKEWEDI